MSKKRPATRKGRAAQTSARQRHVEACIRSLGEDDIEGAVGQLRRAIEQRKPGPRSRSHAVLEREVIGYGMSGLNHKQIAHILGVSPQTWTAWRQERPELQKAFDKGRAAMVLSLKQQLLRRALSGRDTPLIFALKCWAGMSEATAVAEMGTAAPVGRLILPQEIEDSEEWSRRMKQLHGYE